MEIVLSPSLSFWDALQSHGSAPVVLHADSGTTLSYSDLELHVQRAQELLVLTDRGLVLLLPENDIGGIVCYLAALRAGHALFLSPTDLHHSSLTTLIEQYRPEIVLCRSQPLPAYIERDYQSGQQLNGYEILFRRERADPPPHPALGLVLSTSATSGSLKAVRLSKPSLAACAKQVAEALRMGESDRALLTLPLSYVYGLSVLNSGLHAGSSFLLANGTVADLQYWSKLPPARPTVVPTTNYILNCMRQLGVNAAALGSLRKVMHSGEAIDSTAFDWIYREFSSCGTELYLMYGQTEACGRISVLPPSLLPGKRKSVGFAVPGGQISVSTEGEISYRGPGVMLGYANCRDDLCSGDTQGGSIDTGDLGYLDESGLLYLAGRSSRYCKVFGRRLSLDDVEQFVRQGTQAAALERDGKIVIFFEDSVPGTISVLGLATHFRLPPQCFRISTLKVLPRTMRGKISYQELDALFDST